MMHTQATTQLSAALLSLSMLACGGAGQDDFYGNGPSGSDGPGQLGGGGQDDGHHDPGEGGTDDGAGYGGEDASGGQDGGPGDAAPASCDSSQSTCVVVGVYSYENGEYIDRGKELVFTVGAMCQSWSRWTDKADIHSDEGHLHYNAHSDSSYQNGVFTWYEYGPEASQAAIEGTCATGVGGKKKSVSLDAYTPDKMIYLKIKSVTGPDMQG